jgi:hypothetical protein
MQEFDMLDHLSVGLSHNYHAMIGSGYVGFESFESTVVIVPLQPSCRVFEVYL